MGVKVICTLNGMQFDGTATNAIDKSTRDAVLAFIAAQGEADYLNRREMQRRGIDVAKAAADGRYKRRAKALDPATVKAWRADYGKSIAATAAEFEISTATVKRYCAA